MLTKIREWILLAEFLALKAAAGVSNSLEEQIVPKIGRGVEYARKFIIKLECKFISNIRITVSTVYYYHYDRNCKGF